MEDYRESNSYQEFAGVYDAFMADVPYKEWAVYIQSLLKQYEVEDGLVVDLGCGTGTITRFLASAGYEMIGIDCSMQMLQIANEKQKEENADILYLLQDMREFELYGTVKAVVSICDSMNYVLEEEELVQVFSLVNNYLDPEGVFIFDLNTIYKYKEIIGDATIAENREEGSFIWENSFFEEESINQYEVTFFIKEESGLYRKQEETHTQKAYSLEKIQRLLEKGGLEFLMAYDAFTMESPREESERIYIVAREKGK